MSQADSLKAHGNECFAKGKLDAAIEAYSECICLSPGVAVYHTNRALCYHKKAMWDAVVHDCGVVLTIDSRSVKAHYLLGTALVEQQKLREGTEAPLTPTLIARTPTLITLTLTLSRHCTARCSCAGSTRCRTRTISCAHCSRRASASGRLMPQRLTPRSTAARLSWAR